MLWPQQHFSPRVEPGLHPAGRPPPPLPLRVALLPRTFSDAFESVRALAFHGDAYISVCRCKSTAQTVVVKAYCRATLSSGARQQVRLSPAQ